MEYKDLVSVIIPIYKVEQYLPECIDSVLNQTYENLEIILVDDGSPDSCPKICDNYAAKDKRVKVVHKQNGGLSDARNVGLDNSLGNWVMFLDSDDIIHPKMLERMILCAEKSDKIQIVASTYKKFWDNYFFDELSNLSYSVIDFNEYIYKPLYIIACAKLYQKQLFGTVRFPVGKLHEDEFTTWKVCDKAKKIAYLEEPLYLYRQRENSIMTTKTQKNFLNTLEALQERFEYFENKSNDIQCYHLTDIFLDLFCSIKNKHYGYNPTPNELLSLIKLIDKCDVSKTSILYKIKFVIKRYLPHFYLLLFTILGKKKNY